MTTPRKAEVLRLLTAGDSNRNSERNVADIRVKIDAHGTAEATA